MNKTKEKVIVYISIMIIIVIFVLVLFKTGVMNILINQMDKLNGNAILHNNSDKPEIIEIINTSGEEKVNEDVVIFIDVVDDAKIKTIEYSFDNIIWKKVSSITKDGNVITGRVVFNKNMKKIVYVRAINEYDNVSDHKSTKVIIEK